MTEREGSMPPEATGTVEENDNIREEINTRDRENFFLSSLVEFENFAKKELPEEQNVYEYSLGKAKEVLQNTEGIVELKSLPTIVIPDIHARRGMIVEILKQKIKNETVFNLLEQKKINVVCLGDGMHSENIKDWFRNIKGEPATSIKPEIADSLGTMKMIMDLKSQHPENFHYIRGNHDDMDAQLFHQQKGNINQSGLMQRWVNTNFEDFLPKYTDFEQKFLPLLAKLKIGGKDFVFSHTISGDELKAEDIKTRDIKAARSLLWTDNVMLRKISDEGLIDIPEEKLENNVSTTLSNLGLNPRETRWIIGHRPVEEKNKKSFVQFDGRVVQINHPKNYSFAYINSEGSFNPRTDVYKSKKQRNFERINIIDDGIEIGEKTEEKREEPEKGPSKKSATEKGSIPPEATEEVKKTDTEDKSTEDKSTEKVETKKAEPIKLSSLQEALEKLNYLDIEPQEFLKNISEENLKELLAILQVENKKERIGKFTKFVAKRIREVVSEEKLAQERLDDVSGRVYQIIEAGLENEIQKNLNGFGKRSIGKFVKIAGPKILKNIAWAVGIGGAVGLGLAGAATLSTGVAAAIIGSKFTAGGLTGGILTFRRWRAHKEGKEAEETRVKFKKMAEEERTDILTKRASEFISPEKLSAIISNVVRENTSKEALQKMEEIQKTSEKVDEKGSEKIADFNKALDSASSEFYKNAFNYVKAEYKDISEGQQQKMALLITETLVMHLKNNALEQSEMKEIEKNSSKIFEAFNKFLQMRSGRVEGSGYVVGSIALGVGISMAFRSPIGRMTVGAVTGAGAGYEFGRWLTGGSREKRFSKEIYKILDTAEQKIQDVLKTESKETESKETESKETESKETESKSNILEELKNDRNLVASRLKSGYLNADPILKARAKNFIDQVNKLENERLNDLNDIVSKLKTNTEQEFAIREKDRERLEKRLGGVKSNIIIGVGTLLGAGGGALIGRYVSDLRKTDAVPGADAVSGVEEVKSQIDNLGLSEEFKKGFLSSEVGDDLINKMSSDGFSNNELDVLQKLNDLDQNFLLDNLELLENLPSIDEEQVKLIERLSKLEKTFWDEHKNEFLTKAKEGLKGEDVGHLEVKYNHGILTLNDENIVLDENGDLESLKFTGVGSRGNYLEQILNKLAIDELEDDISDGRLTLEIKSKALNMAANMVRLVQGENVAGIEAEEYQNIFLFNKEQSIFEIKDWNRFKELLTNFKKNVNEISEQESGLANVNAYAGNVDYENLTEGSRVITETDWTEDEIQKINASRKSLVEARLNQAGLNEIITEDSAEYDILTASDRGYTGQGFNEFNFSVKIDDNDNKVYFQDYDGDFDLDVSQVGDNVLEADCVDVGAVLANVGKDQDSKIVLTDALFAAQIKRADIFPDGVTATDSQGIAKGLIKSWVLDLEGLDKVKNFLEKYKNSLDLFKTAGTIAPDKISFAAEHSDFTINILQTYFEKTDGFNSRLGENITPEKIFELEQAKIGVEFLDTEEFKTMVLLHHSENKFSDLLINKNKQVMFNYTEDGEYYYTNRVTGQALSASVNNVSELTSEKLKNLAEEIKNQAEKQKARFESLDKAAKDKFLGIDTLARDLDEGYLRSGINLENDLEINPLFTMTLEDLRNKKQFISTMMDWGKEQGLRRFGQKDDLDEVRKALLNEMSKIENSTKIVGDLLK